MSTTTKEKRAKAHLVKVAKKMLEPCLREKLIVQMMAASIILRACIDAGFDTEKNRKQVLKEVIAWAFQKPRAKARTRR